jgi:hypothetical protein
VIAFLFCFFLGVFPFASLRSFSDWLEAKDLRQAALAIASCVTPIAALSFESEIRGFMSFESFSADIFPQSFFAYSCYCSLIKGLRKP